MSGSPRAAIPRTSSSILGRSSAVATTGLFPWAERRGITPGSKSASPPAKSAAVSFEQVRETAPESDTSAGSVGVTLTLTATGLWQFSWSAQVTKGDPSVDVWIEGEPLGPGTGAVHLQAADSTGAINGGGVAGRWAAGDMATFDLTPSATYPPGDTGITLTVQADLIRRGL